MPKVRRVAIIYDAKLPYDVKVMKGIARYLRERVSWNVYIQERALHDQQLPFIHAWRGDGVIADLDDPHVARAVSRLKIPVVGFGGGYGWYDPASDIPYFFADNEAIAYLVVEHFRQRAFHNLAFCGYPQTPINGWSDERAETFVDAAKASRCGISIYRGHHKTSRAWEPMYRALCTWLKSLPKPVGLMAANDKRGREVLEACRIAGLRVPEDVAVVGVDNDEMLCEFCNPSLTSVEQGCRQLGYKAAALLGEMMSRQNPRRRKFIIAPKGIITRQSSDTLAVEDPTIAAALTMIREHSSAGITVQDMVRSLGVSRSRLEAHFQAVMGRSMAAELRRVRLETAKRLVTETDCPLKEVASRTGFTSVQYMTTLFHRLVGQTPARLRRDVHIVSRAHENRDRFYR